MKARYFAFEPFCLDVADERLWRDDVSVQLGRKAFAVLAALVTNPNQLVTKDELLAAAWPGTSVSEAVLTTAMREIRVAVGDTARTPRFVQTVYGRGYRFIAPVTETGARRMTGPAPAQGGIVGREAELLRLGEWFADVRTGRRRVVFIAGEAGIGKTALVDAFVAGIGAPGSVQVCRGQCIEQYGAGEAYLPLLEALAGLGRDPGSTIARTLRERAPSWLAHLPSLAAQPERSISVPPARMLREVTEALEALATDQPLLLTLEDLHWSDDATLVWLEYFARRREPTRLLVLGTYRPVESLLQRRRLRDLLTDLGHQPQCGELVLDYLSGDAVHTYVRRQCGDRPGLDDLGARLYRRTGGHPLFLVGLVEQVLSGQMNRGASGLDLPPDAIPMNVRQFIERRFEQLPEDDQAVIEAASVAGEPFSVAAIVAAASLSDDIVESRCDTLARVHRLFVPHGVVAWPDGTLAAGYAFRHALFQETAYARISPERRARLHLAIGTRLEEAHRRNPSLVAAELGMHFEHARHPAKALSHLEQAARNAMDRSAYPEAHRHVSSALTMLNAIGDPEERTRREAIISLLLGQLLDTTKGWGVEEAGRAYEKARDLCIAAGDESRWFQATWGLIVAGIVRAELHQAQVLARDLLALAKKRRSRRFRMAAHAELGGTLLALGRAAASRRHFRLADALDQSDSCRSDLATFGMDMTIFTRTWSTHLMWHDGCPDRARALADRAIAAAGTINHPFTRTIALAYAAMLAQFRRDTVEVARLAGAAIELASMHGFPYYRAWCEILRGWSLICDARSGKREDDTVLGEMRKAVDVVRTTAGFRLPYYRGLLAEAYERLGRAREGLDEIASAMDGVRRTGECWWEPELVRIRGTLLQKADRGDVEGAACFRRAVNLARQSGARILELRALTSLVKTACRARHEREAVRRRLADAYAGFTEGFDTPDLRDARAVLDAAG